jgi:hypothetical protein
MPKPIKTSAAAIPPICNAFFIADLPSGPVFREWSRV